MKNYVKLLLVKKFFSILIFIAFGFSIPIYGKNIHIMSYNVENLFDHKHDEGKNDWSFLPKETIGKKDACAKERGKHRKDECFDADWTEEKVNIKLSQIVDVISKGRSTLPDILALIEVENLEVVTQLAKKLGYPHIEMTNSPDFRGIDVALLYRDLSDLKLIQKSEHNVPVEYPTRNILEIEFELAGNPLTIFVNHWPSLANPDSWRVKAAEVLAERTKAILNKKSDMNFIAIGDFNTIPENNPHPFMTVLHKDNLYFDAYERCSDTRKKMLPKGTYYFAPKKQWNMLDRIFFSKSLSDQNKLEIDLETLDIYLPAFALKELPIGLGKEDEKNIKIEMIPKRFEPQAKSKDKQGFSDHFTISVKLNYPDLTQAKYQEKTILKKNDKLKKK